MTPTDETSKRLTDLALVRRLERAEGATNAAFIEARARIEPASVAQWRSVGGVYAMFDGADSPLTQTFGLGIFEEAEDRQFQVLERFFIERRAPVMHEVSPYISVATLARLTERGYRPIELSTVLVRSTSMGARADSPIAVREIASPERELWANIGAEGWSSESPELAAFVESFGRIITRAENVHCFLAEAGGTPIATGALSIQDGVALLAGASTIPGGRRLGAQRALLEERLRFAASRGADLAMMVAQPGSGSQRNAERQGFSVVYTRTKWELGG